MTPHGGDVHPLVTATGVAARLGAPDLVICDVRWYLGEPDRGAAEYAEAHLPGALFVDLATDLAGGPDAVGGGRHPLPSTARFIELLARLGIDQRDHVVVYDDSGGASAARMWWMLEAIGHRHVQVLDGGFRAWLAAGLPVSDEMVSEVPVAPTPHPDPGRWAGIVDAAQLAALVTTGTTVIDARAAERFRGEHEPIDPRAGHIPGAINRPHLDSLDHTGHHLAAAALRARFEGLGPEPVVYCGSGVTACHALLAMAAAGITDGRLYPGSWSDWVSDPSRPVATGDA